MTATVALARCTTRACPVRYRTGPDRPCLMCAPETADTLNGRMTAMGVDVAAAPAGRHDDSEAT